MFFLVQYHPGKSRLARGYVCGYVDFDLRVL